uniref:Uncharacterized protein n=1 Tax=Kalanchoe fedtschenkoi TaxID=63787 RepID=A0A7N1A9S3_KALFE
MEWKLRLHISCSNVATPTLLIEMLLRHLADQLNLSSYIHIGTYRHWQIRDLRVEWLPGCWGSILHRLDSLLEVNSCKMILPGMDLSDEHQLEGSLSSPESLLAQVMSSCSKHNVEVSGQNSSISQVPGGFGRIKKNLLDENAAVDLFTYQRMGALFFSPENFRSFTELVRSLSQPSMGVDDLPGVNVRTAELKQAEAKLQMQAA